jgi:adenylate cyclase class 2
MARELLSQKSCAGCGSRNANFMPIEIEKKYRLTKKQREQLLRRLRKIGATPKAEEFEENTLYAGEGIVFGQSVLRLRRVGKRAILTYKERFPSTSSIKHQQEDETEVSDADAIDAILQALGYRPALVYEKRRSIWHMDDAEVDVDELPFGLFMEIEAKPEEILRVEKLLSVKGLQAEMETYPGLTLKHGDRDGDVVVARFSLARKSSRKKR